MRTLYNILTTFYFFLMTLSLQSHDFNITSIHELLKTHPEIEYIKCHDAQPFEYKPFPISRFPELQPNKGILAESFVVKIPNGQVCSCKGWIKIENTIIEELIPPHFSFETQRQLLKQTPFKKSKKIKGKCVVITTLFDTVYCHWINHILCRLALIEMQGIEYDWLYVACDKPYMKETLALWGIDPKKIIQPAGESQYIEADELIVPSLIGVRIPQSHEYVLNWVPLDQYYSKWNIDPQSIYLGNNIINDTTDIIPAHIATENYFLRSTPLCSNYFYPFAIEYIRNKFLSCIQNINHKFSKKIFISRKDAGGRQVNNENEIFALFEKKGFTQYALGNMSITDQIALFHGAEIIVATHGSALINIIFCKPNTKVIEIFQARSDSCFYYLSQILKLDHHCIQTIEFPDIVGAINTTIPPSILQDFIERNQSLFNNPKEQRA